MSHSKHERDVVFLRASVSACTFQGTGKTVTDILKEQLKGFSQDIYHSIYGSIFDLGIELKRTWLTSVWVTSIHCIESRWVTPFQLVAIDKMWKLSLEILQGGNIVLCKDIVLWVTEKSVYWEITDWVMWLLHLLKKSQQQRVSLCLSNSN